MLEIRIHFPPVVIITIIVLKMIYIFCMCKKYLISQRYRIPTNLTWNDLKTYI